MLPFSIHSLFQETWTCTCKTTNFTNFDKCRRPGCNGTTLQALECEAQSHESVNFYSAQQEPWRCDRCFVMNEVLLLGPAVRCVACKCERRLSSSLQKNAVIKKMKYNFDNYFHGPHELLAFVDYFLLKTQYSIYSEDILNFCIEENMGVSNAMQKIHTQCQMIVTMCEMSLPKALQAMAKCGFDCKVILAQQDSKSDSCFACGRTIKDHKFCTAEPCGCKTMCFQCCLEYSTEGYCCGKCGQRVKGMNPIQLQCSHLQFVR